MVQGRRIINVPNDFCKLKDWEVACGLSKPRVLSLGLN